MYVHVRVFNLTVCLFFYSDKDPCHPNPCKNTGSCLHTSDGGFVCNCSIGFKGDTCQGKQQWLYYNKCYIFHSFFIEIQAT